MIGRLILRYAALNFEMTTCFWQVFLFKATYEKQPRFCNLRLSDADQVEQIDDGWRNKN